LIKPLHEDEKDADFYFITPEYLTTL